MNKAISLAIPAGGILVTVFGINAISAAGFDISRFFTGAPIVIGILVDGPVVSVTGVAGLRPGSQAE